MKNKILTYVIEVTVLNESIDSNLENIKTIKRALRLVAKKYSINKPFVDFAMSRTVGDEVDKRIPKGKNI